MRQIILIEDDPAIREGLSEFLQSEGCVVSTAENGLIGLELIRKHKGTSLVLLDLQMPVMTGEQLLEELTKETNPAVRDVPVLVLTARGAGFSHPRINGLLRKPLNLDDFIAKVNSLCSESS